MVLLLLLVLFLLLLLVLLTDYTLLVVYIGCRCITKLSIHCQRETASSSPDSKLQGATRTQSGNAGTGQQGNRQQAAGSQWAHARMESPLSTPGYLHARFRDLPSSLSASGPRVAQVAQTAAQLLSRDGAGQRP